MINFEKVLLVSPHADDEVFGAGGTLLKFKKKGARIKLALAVAGDIEFSSMDRFVSREERLEEFRKSAAVLSTEEPFFFDNEDRNLESRLDTVPIRNLIEQIDALINEFKPDVMFVPEPSHHQDHQVVHRACISSLRPSARTEVRNVILYEESGAHWGPTGSFKPNMIVDVSDYFEEKMRVFEEVYTSQLMEGRKCYSLDGVRNYAHYRGYEIGAEYAEAFEIVRCSL